MIRLVSITPDCEKTIVYCARVSSSNQDNPEIEKLINYCAKNGHWSIFEMGNMIIEVEAPRYVTTQILRHKSFSFQEFSQRYAAISPSSSVSCPRSRQVIATPSFRSLNGTNRQSSSEIHPRHDQYLARASDIIDQTFRLYDEMVQDNVSCETARAILPLCVMSRIYMNGTIRSWIHYLKSRCDQHTQLEHRLIAQEIEKIFAQNLPTIHRACFGHTASEKE